MITSHGTCARPIWQTTRNGLRSAPTNVKSVKSDFRMMIPKSSTSERRMNTWWIKKVTFLFFLLLLLFIFFFFFFFLSFSFFLFLFFIFYFYFNPCLTILFHRDLPPASREAGSSSLPFSPSWSSKPQGIVSEESAPPCSSLHFEQPGIRRRKWRRAIPSQIQPWRPRILLWCGHSWNSLSRGSLWRDGTDSSKRGKRQWRGPRDCYKRGETHLPKYWDIPLVLAVPAGRQQQVSTFLSSLAFGKHSAHSASPFCFLSFSFFCRIFQNKLELIFLLLSDHRLNHNKFPKNMNGTILFSFSWFLPVS